MSGYSPATNRLQVKPCGAPVSDFLPFSQACENNKPYILEVLQRVFADRTQVLEIGSGTGQHACHFVQHMPWLCWQPTETAENLAVLRRRIDAFLQAMGATAAQADAADSSQSAQSEKDTVNAVPSVDAVANVSMRTPVALNVCEFPWPVPVPNALFTANTLHIMSFAAVEAFFAALAKQAPEDTVLAIYGPFNYGGNYTSASNARFDQWLLQQHPDSAIRDFEAVNALALAGGFHLQEDVAMPANNRLLVWRRA